MISSWFGAYIAYMATWGVDGLTALFLWVMGACVVMVCVARVCIWLDEER